MDEEVFERMVDEYKLAQHRQDEKEFEELWNFTDEEEFTHNSYEYRVGKYYWLASRRLLREKELRELEESLTIKTLENAKGAQVLSNVEARVKELEKGIEKVLVWRNFDGDGISDPLRKELYKLVEICREGGEMHTNRVDTAGNPIGEVNAGDHPASVSSDLLDGRCYANMLHPTKARCQKIAKWKGRGTGNFTDEWKWCDEHAPDAPFREAI